MESLDAMKVSEEKKKYIVEELNPLLEAIVRECMRATPEDPVPFMLKFLEEKRIKLEEEELSAQEKEEIEEENAGLEEQMKKVKSQMCTAAKFVVDEQDTKDGDDAEQDEDEEEEDDSDDEPPPGFFRDEAAGMKARASVSAEAYGEWNRKQKFVAPVVQKSDAQKDRLKEVLSKSFMFSNLDDHDLAAVIGAMKEVSAESDEVVIKQGDAGDFLFVVESGSLDCLIKISQSDEQKKVKTCGVGDVVGELALLYNAPRAATVKAADKSILWQLDRDTFTNLVRDAAQKKRDRYDQFLRDVPLLQSMDAYERGQLSDALKVEVFGDGDAIVKAGDNGNKFYIIEDGNAEAEKNGEVVMQYKAGDYFGELALIRNQPRAATVTAKGMVKVLSLDSGSFKRLLNVNDLLERAVNMYG
mmetsp:Transcript_55112/g.131329  ORF Transcript_55112/g.131329 Transcript_55112/m.131329 type:complete len:414 (-) Transcript_55112:271-1512(-)